MILAVSVSLAFWGYGPAVGKVKPTVIQADVVGFLQWLILDSDESQNSQNKNKPQGYQPDNSKEAPLTDKMIRQARFLLENMPAVSKKSNQPEEIFPEENWETPQPTTQKSSSNIQRHPNAIHQLSHQRSPAATPPAFRW